MFESQTEYDFEDLFFHLDTPGGIDRNVMSLDSAWQLLKRKFPNDDFIVHEVEAWEKWAKDILDSSWLYKTLPVGIAEELEGWKKRYAQAYASVSDKSRLVRPDHIFDKSWYENPIVWIALTAIAMAGLYVYAKTKK